MIASASTCWATTSPRAPVRRAAASAAVTGCARARTDERVVLLSALLGGVSDAPERSFQPVSSQASVGLVLT
jgi:hypothetical protein